MENLKNVSHEITIDVSPLPNETLLLLCVDCGIEFDPQSEEQKNIPSANYCSKCYPLRFQMPTLGNA